MTETSVRHLGAIVFGSPNLHAGFSVRTSHPTDVVVENTNKRNDNHIIHSLDFEQLNEENASFLQSNIKFQKPTTIIMCLMCFSKEPLSQSEMKGKYGGAYQQFLHHTSTYDISLCETPCREPCCWLGSMVCLCPAQIHMRHKALNHVDPGSGWSNYKCCQGYFGGCCCFQPGQMCERTCPLPCMCLEAFLCPGAAVSATSNVIREEYRLGLDEDDVRIIRCSNCLQIFAFCLTCVARCTDCEGDDAVAHCVNILADVVFCCVSGCMTAQVHHEIKLREKASSPQRERMDRY